VNDAAIRLEAGLQQLGFENADALAQQLLEFADLLLAANRRTNLVGAKSADELMVKHFLDSLAPLADVALLEPIVDVGSGAGLPGIPAALAWPQHSFVLLEPRAQRAEFLKEAVVALRLRNVEIVQASAESAGHGASRGRFGTALVRALAKPERALALALPLLRRGGSLVLYQGRASQPSPQIDDVIHRLGARLKHARPVAVPQLDAARHVWIIEKTRNASLSDRQARGVRHKRRA
jgi:16S rRNA (guanine527-N7)-methyltransferase